MNYAKALALLALVFSVTGLLQPVSALSLVSPYWNITVQGSVVLSFVPLVDGVPFEDIVIMGETTKVVESSTNRASESSVFEHDLTSGGSWRIESSIVTPTSTGDYTSLHPVNKTDLIWEKELVEGQGNFMSIITSIFNVSTFIVRTGGLPVQVSADRFKITYILSNWTNYNEDVNYVTLSLSSNVLTEQLPSVSIYYPQGATNPFVYGAGVADRWQFNMTLDRWTLINHEMQYIGQLVPSFTNGDTFETRNEVGVALIYPTAGIKILEYDPTGLFALFDSSPPVEDSNQPGNKKKGTPYWIIGVVLGILAIAAISLILVLKVPALHSIVFPHKNRAIERQSSIATQRASVWVPSATPGSDV